MKSRVRYCVMRVFLAGAITLSIVPSVWSASRSPMRPYASGGVGWQGAALAAVAASAGLGLVGWNIYRQAQGEMQAYIRVLNAALLSDEVLASPEHIEMLIRRGAQIDAAGADGLTPIFKALVYPESVKKLIQLGADVNHGDKDGDTPLLFACGFPDTRLGLEIVDILLDGGADVNKGRNTGVTPLIVGVAKNNHALVDRLLRANALLEVRDSDGDTALIYAARANNLEMTRHLLEAGADTYARDNKGKAAIDFTSSAELADLLKKRGTPPQLIKVRQLEEDKNKIIESLNELEQEMASLDETKKEVIMDQYLALKALREILQQDPKQFGYGDYERMLRATIVRNKQDGAKFDDRTIERFKRSIGLIDPDVIANASLNFVMSKLAAIRDALHALLAKKHAALVHESQVQSCALCEEPASPQTPLGPVCTNAECAKKIVCKSCYGKVMEEVPPHCPFCRGNKLYRPFQPVEYGVIEQPAAEVVPLVEQPPVQAEGFWQRLWGAR